MTNQDGFKRSLRRILRRDSLRAAVDAVASRSWTASKDVRSMPTIRSSEEYSSSEVLKRVVRQLRDLFLRNRIAGQETWLLSISAGAREKMTIFPSPRKLTSDRLAMSCLFESWTENSKILLRETRLRPCVLFKDKLFACCDHFELIVTVEREQLADRITCGVKRPFGRTRVAETYHLKFQLL